MTKSSDDLYNQIMKKLEEKEVKINREDNFNSSKFNNDKNNQKTSMTVNKAKSDKIKEFLDNNDEINTKKKNKSKNKKVKENKKNKSKKENYNNINKKKNDRDNNYDVDYKDIKKTRRLLICLVFIQLMLLATLCYMLYSKIFETKTKILKFNNMQEENIAGKFISQGKINIPSLNINENIYEKSEELSKTHITLFRTEKGLNKFGNTVLVGGNVIKNKAFYNLHKLKVGDKINIVLENKEDMEYVVTDNKEVEVHELDVLISEPKVEITLITHSKEGDERIIVKAKAAEEEPEEIKNLLIYKSTTDQLNVRPKPSFNNTPIGSLSLGKEVVVLKRSGDWYEIQYGSGIGYVNADYLKKVREEKVSSKPNFGTKENQLKKIKEKYKELP